MTQPKMIHVTAYDQDGTAIRLSLNPETAIEINDKRWSMGITMERCWFGRNRIVTEKYSIWNNGKDNYTGTVYSVITDKAEILTFCALAEIDPPSWILAEEV